MSCVVADNSSSALKIPLLDYLLLHKDPPSYLSDPPHRKDNRQYNTCTPTSPKSRTNTRTSFPTAMTTVERKAEQFYLLVGLNSRSNILPRSAP